jgi:hypothetical protein
MDKDVIKMLEMMCYVATENFISSSAIPFFRVDKGNKWLARMKGFVAEKSGYCHYNGAMSVTGVI